MKASRSITALPTRQATEKLLKTYLRQGGKAVRRLDDDGDIEALHALRVTLRRMRAVLTAYTDDVPGSGHKLRKPVRRLLALTSASRDKDITLAWLAALAQDIHQDPAYPHLIELVAAQHEAGTSSPRRIRKDFAKLEAKILLKKARPGPDDSYFSQAASAQIATASERLAALLDALLAHPDENLAHKTRVAGKRLRYLVEPLCTTRTRKRDILAPLTVLQDTLGEIQDCRASAALLSSVASAYCARYGADLFLAEAVRPPDPLPLLHSIAALLDKRRQSAWHRFTEISQDGSLAALFTALAQLSAALAKRKRGGNGGNKD